MEVKHHFLQICIIVSALVLTEISLSSCSDPDPLQDFCVADPTKFAVNGFACKDPTATNPTDFKSTLLRKGGNTSNTMGSALTIATASSFPGLNSQGLSFARIDYAKGGLVPPHSHPRASEVLFVLKGSLLAGFVDTQSKLYSQRLEEGDLFLFPRGLTHFILNVGNGPALSLSSLNSQNPGAAIVAKTLFGSKPLVPDAVLAKAFQISVIEVHAIEQAIAKLG